MCRLLLGIMLISIGCSKVEPVMSKAGVMTIPRCAKYSEEIAVATAISSEYLAHLGMVITPAFDITGSTLLQPIEMSMIPKRRRHIIFLRSKTFLNLLNSSSYQIFSFWMICPSFDVSHRTPSSFPSSWPYPFPSWRCPS